MTEDLEDGGDQSDADDADVKTLEAVCQDPVKTIGIDGEKLGECESDEESNVDDDTGGLLNLEMVREARVEQLVSAVLTN